MSTPEMDKAHSLVTRARQGARVMSTASSAQKNAALLRIRELLDENKADLLEANAKDLAAGEEHGLGAAMLDRLKLSDSRLQSLKDALADIANAPDPVGAVSGLQTRPSGIQVGRMQVPLGVIMMIYESRPNVTVDAAALCLKAGNAIILRGGKEAKHSNAALAALVQQALRENDLDDGAAVLVDTPDRNVLYALLKQSGIDLAIPRGGTSLIDAVNEHARVPVLQHYQGICHVVVDAAADLDMAERIVVNAKTQRPGVCNAMEGLVVDAAVADAFIPRITTALKDKGVRMYGCERTRALADDVEAATPEHFDTEFLDLACAIQVVDDYDAALAFVAAHGTQHTETIVTNDHTRAMHFTRAVDASCVMVNASTRFNDGGELGLGAELGISTTKLHAYGPMGLDELCTKKFVVLGHGEVRG